METTNKYPTETDATQFIEKFKKMNREAASRREEGDREGAQTLHREMLNYAKSSGVNQLIAEAHSLVGLDALELGDYKLAQDELQRSVDVYYELNDAVALGRGLANLANVLRIQGIFDEAKRCSIQALTFVRRTGNQRHEMVILGNLAAQEIDRGNHRDAKPFLQLAIELARALGDFHAEVMYLGDLAKIYDSDGRMDAAFDVIDRAVKLARKHDLRREEGMVCGIAGLIAASKSQWERAQVSLEQALVIHRETKELRFVGITLHNLGMVALTTGDAELAERYLYEANSIHRTTGNILSEALTLSLQAELAFCCGDISGAESMLHQALQIAIDTKNRGFEAMAMVYLSMIEIERGHTEEAMDKLIEAVTIQREIGKPRELPATLCQMAALFSELEKFDYADVCLREVDEIAVRTREFIILMLAAVAHGFRCIYEGETRKANEWYWQALSQIEQYMIGSINSVGHFFLRLREQMLQSGIPEENLPLPKNWE